MHIENICAMQCLMLKQDLSQGWDLSCLNIIDTAINTTDHRIPPPSTPWLS